MEIYSEELLTDNIENLATATIGTLFIIWLKIPFGDMTSLEPLRNSQSDFSLGVTLKYIMLQSRGLRAKTRGVNEVVLWLIAVIKSSLVFNL